MKTQGKWILFGFFFWGLLGRQDGGNSNRLDFWEQNHMVDRISKHLDETNKDGDTPVDIEVKLAKIEIQ